MRPEILFPLFAPVSSLKGVGPRLEPLVVKVAGPLVRDVMFVAPHNIIDRRHATIDTALEGDCQTLTLVIDRHQSGGRASAPYKVLAHDDSGFITLVWFKGGGPHMLKSLPIGEVRLVSGKVERRGDVVQIVHPDYIASLDKADEIPEVETVYPLTAGLPPRTMRRIVLAALERAPELAEWQDPAFLKRNGWLSWHGALSKLHAPSDLADLDVNAPTRRRLAFDELLAHQLAMMQRKAARQAQPAPRLMSGAMSAAVEAALPFTLTKAQQRALGEIRVDQASGSAMSRLLQGDVGSGKTVVALLAMADAASGGFQAALMAPTEILARQHCQKLTPLLDAAGISSVILTGRDKGAGRAAKLAGLADGSTSIAFGTHALFQDDVHFKQLAMAVVDEQHRFGVKERKRLQDKGAGVHLLSMSATPIPRTLELTQYGDLEVSRLDEKPPGRKPIVTRAVPTARMDDIVARLDSVLKEGARAYWICPLVAESELADLAAAENRVKDLQARLRAPVGLAHGQMPAAERDAVMTDFAEGRVSVLVATTVVEVGVDVPEATIMVIEHAERFGLAQLHQLRGRVGRGSGESACILLYDAPLSETARQRLDVLRESEDGFLIAEKDWALRGGGDLLGLKQSGFPDYRLADPMAHKDLLFAAADDARLVLARDPKFESARGQALKVLCELFDWRPERSGQGG
jgi:ATP-dependent DNA helicase RecG